MLILVAGLLFDVLISIFLGASALPVNIIIGNFLCPSYLLTLFLFCKQKKKEKRKKKKGGRVPEEMEG
jgi:hypothetical protein